MIIPPPKTIKIAVDKHGNVSGSLSPDIAQMSEYFLWELDIAHKKLKLIVSDGHSNGQRPMKAWETGIRSKSRRIGLKGIFKNLGIDAKEVKGKVYDVKVRGKTLEVQF